MSEAFSVLIVDDHSRTRALLKTLLGAIGFADVTEAGTGEEALAQLRQRRIGLVISDYHMRPMTGLELIGHIRGDDEPFDTPFILISGDSDLNLIRSAARSGVDMLIKPFRPEELLKAVRHAVGAAALANG